MIGYSVHHCEQRTPEWFECRRGRLTGSVAGDITAKGRDGGEAVTRRNLRIRLALERLTRKCLDRGGGYQSAAMKTGTEMEPEARAMYEAISSRIVSEVGFVASGCGRLGYSPDAVVVDADFRITHVVELKCPEWAAHLGYLQTGKIGKDYEAQVAHGFLVTGCDSLDWMSYNPDFPEKLQHKLLSFTRDSFAEAIAQHAAHVDTFFADVNTQVEELERMAT